MGSWVLSTTTPVREALLIVGARVLDRWQRCSLLAVVVVDEPRGLNFSLKFIQVAPLKGLWPQRS
jgi:hypothetical protein